MVPSPCIFLQISIYKMRSWAQSVYTKCQLVVTGAAVTTQPNHVDHKKRVFIATNYFHRYFDTSFSFPIQFRTYLVSFCRLSPTIPIPEVKHLLRHFHSFCERLLQLWKANFSNSMFFADSLNVLKVYL